MLGISIYVSEFTEEYVRGASKYIDYVFTSLHIPEEKIESERLAFLLKLCRELNLKVVCDISPHTFEKFKLANNDFRGLRALGVDCVRLDFGFEDQHLLNQLTDYFEVILNGSVIAVRPIEQVDRVCHNFYPLPGSGLSEEEFMLKNDAFHKLGYHIQAFIPGDKLRRFPLRSGLVTLEQHRDYNPYVAGAEMLLLYGIDDLIIGDSEVSIKYLEYLYLLQNKKTAILEAYLYSGSDLFEHPIEIRVDSGRDFVRLNSQRQQIAAQYNYSRKLGDILQFNEFAGRYSGELYLPKRDLAYCHDSNKLGFINPEFSPLIALLRDIDKIEFRRLTV